MIDPPSCKLLINRHFVVGFIQSKTMEDTEDHFSLKWSNFRSSLTEGFHDFLREEMMVDVTLAAEGKFVQAHKLVLSVCSPYFKNLFKVNPCKHPIVILKDVGHNELSCMLQFMYKGEVGVKHEDLPSFLKLADTLKVKGLAGEKIEMKNNGLTNKPKHKMARVRKKKSKRFCLNFDKENSESESANEKQLEGKTTRGKKRRLSSKIESVKKARQEKCEEKLSFESVCVSDGEGDGDEDDNPLAKLIVSKLNSDKESKQSDCFYSEKISGDDGECGGDGFDNDDNDDEDDDDDDELLRLC